MHSKIKYLESDKFKINLERSKVELKNSETKAFKEQNAELLKINNLRVASLNKDSEIKYLKERNKEFEKINNSLQAEVDSKNRKTKDLQEAISGQLQFWSERAF